MILFWNKYEVFIWHSMIQFNKLRDFLSSAKIDSAYKVVNPEGSRNAGTLRSRTGSSGISAKHSYLYYVYVHKKDAEAARKVHVNQG